MIKSIRTRRLCFAVAVSSALLLAFSPKSQADLIYTVSVNTASLTTNANAPFSLDVALSSGSQFPDADNTVKLTNFLFTGGSAGAVTFSNGGETGSMSSSVTLTNSALDNELAQTFGSGVTQISFNVDETSNTNNPFQDQFSVAILDSGLGNIPTTDPSGGNTLVLSNINTAQTLASVNSYQSTAGGEAPGVTTTIVPEPASVVGLLVGFGAIGLCARKKAFRGFARA